MTNDSNEGPCRHSQINIFEYLWLFGSESELQIFEFYLPNNWGQQDLALICFA